LHGEASFPFVPNRKGVILRFLAIFVPAEGKEV
jgi:hypothetical protein